MDKLKMHTPDLTDANIARIAELFPNCVTEAKDDKGGVKRAIDFDLLRQELSDHVVDGPRERYHLDWPGKREALVVANASITRTLRPCRDESVEFDTTRNLFIEADNLDALKLLQESYLNRVKMIYIDPPYNTGQDFLYSDRFNEEKTVYESGSGQRDESGRRLVANLESDGRFHSNWMNMMYPRLRLARNLLRDDGLIFISIDDGELANLQKLCDEIFGRRNRIENVAWKNKYGSGALTRGFANVHEYVLVYSKQPVNNIAAPLDDDQRAAYKNKDSKFTIRGGFITQPLATTSKDDRPNLRYPIEHEGVEIWPEKQWIWSKERTEEARRNDELVINETAGKYSVRTKQYLRDENGVERLGKPISFLNGPFNQAGTKEITELLGKGVFSFPKPSELVRYFFSFVVNNDPDPSGIYLDFFAGSGTSADAIISLNSTDAGNRQFILVQLPEPCGEETDAFKAGYKSIADVAKERIRRIGVKYREQVGLTGQNLDIGFRVLRADSSNMKPVYYSPDSVAQATLPGHIDNIEAGRTNEDLLFQVLLDWGVDLTLPIQTETIQDKCVFVVDTNALAACFDSGINEAFIKEL
ncbi:MAG: site-specific DNA-methyltransferase, partial [Phycisphaerales bacterium]|nr:site-specific DNA-methyltransferase [Phycisphaerales bacterium]